MKRFCSSPAWPALTTAGTHCSLLVCSIIFYHFYHLKEVLKPSCRCKIILNSSLLPWIPMFPLVVSIHFSVIHTFGEWKLGKCVSCKLGHRRLLGYLSIHTNTPVRRRLCCPSSAALSRGAGLRHPASDKEKLAQRRSSCHQGHSEGTIINMGVFTFWALSLRLF